MKDNLPFYMKKYFYYGIFIILVSFLFLAVFLIFKAEKKNILQQKTRELRNITQLKSRQVNAWFEDELNDAWEIGLNTSFVYNKMALAGQPEDEFNRIITNYLKGAATEHDYSIIFLTDSVGNILYSSSKLAVTSDPIANKVLHQTLPGRASTTDIFYTEDGVACIDFITSLDIETARYPVPVFMVMRINPEDDLYPTVERTNVNTSTEIILLRKVNNSTQVLSRLINGSNHNHGQVNSDTSTFNTLILNIEGEGSFQGLDYRGQKVLGYTVRIENTSWFILTKTDESEALQEYFNKIFLVIPIILLGIILTALFILYYNSLRSNKYYRSYGAEQAKFKTTIYSIGDGVIITDKEGVIKNLNTVAEQTTGWKESEALGRPVTEVFNIINETSRNSVENPVIQVFREGTIIGLANHTLLIRRDGSEIPIADSAAPIIDENNEVSGAVLVFRDKTAEHQRQAAIEKSELSYRRMFINNPQPMLIYNVEDFRVLEVNDAMIAKYGYSREEFLQMDVKSLRPDEEISGFVHEMTTEAGNILHMGKVWKHRLKNGSTIFVEISSHLITYNNQPARHVLIADISQRLEAEEALQNSEQKFRMLFENHSAKKIIIDPETRKIEDANWAASKFYGWSREEFRGMDLSVINVLPKDEISKLIQGLESLTESTFEFKHRKRDGTLFDAEVFSSKIFTDDKVVLHSIIHDITERKKAEEKVSLLIRSINQSPVGILITDDAAITTYVNPYLCEMTGYSEEELLGTTPFLLNTASEPLYSDVKLLLSRGEEWKGEFEEKKKNGEKFWKNVAISSVRNASGSVTNYVFIQEDITMRRNIMHDLIESQQRAEESDRLKSSFLANMSHEIRTPMNGILGFMDLLQDPNLTGDEREEYMGIVRSSGNRLLSTINDIIDISKIESGQVVLNISQFNINNLLQRLHLFFNAEAENANLKLILDGECETGEAIIHSDLSKIESIYNNLIRNAIKFTDSGQVVFGCMVKNNKLHGFVKDTGSGIPDDRIGAIFDRFVQADTSYSRTYEGSGLGLAITKAFVEMLGGNITVRSTPGEGSRFDFVINIESGESEALPLNKAGFSEIPEKHEAIILVAEDDEVSYIFLTKLLAGRKIKFLHAHTGKEAVEFYLTHPEINLVLMDIKMPVMDGYEATRIIKSLKPELPVIAVTAFAFSEDRDKAMAAGCDEYLSKPLNRSAVIEIIDRFL